MTVAMYEQLQKETAQKTALQMADSISDTNERELTKYHIENTIRASGNPTEVARVQIPARHGSAPGAPALALGKDIVLTPEEMSFMRPPFSLSKEQIIASRPK